MDELYTRCPTCRTVFRTREDQLAVQSGKVRCGHCRMVFDGREHLVDLRPQPSQAYDEAMMGTPTVTLRTSIEPESRPRPADEAAAPPHPEPTADVRVEADQAEASPAPEVVTPYNWQAADREERRRARWRYGTLSLLLLAALGLQAAFHFRNVIAAQNPELRPHLVAACNLLDCVIEPTHYRDEVGIDSHDLQADPAHQGLLILQTTIRNRAAHPVAFPHLELELDDMGGQPIVRRVFAPVEYAGGAADFAVGIPANGEWNVKLFLDASAIAAGGYKLYLFYL